MGFLSDPIGSVLRGLLSIGYDGPSERVNTAIGPDGEQIVFREKATDITTEYGSYGRGYTQETTTIGAGWSSKRVRRISREP